MERTIMLSTVRTALQDAYEKFRNLDVADVAAPDDRTSSLHPDPQKFGLVATLTDGTQIALGDTDIAVPMTTISKAPIMLNLLTQYKPKEIAERLSMGHGCCGNGGCAKPSKPKVPVSAKGIRAMSLMQPTGDPDGKWVIYSSLLIGLAGSELTLSDGFYQKLMGDNKAAGTENLLADAGWFLFDDAPASIELYTKASAMLASAEQLSAIGATIAADGYNPLTKANVFDGDMSARVTAYMAAKGPHKMAKPWLMISGLPALSSYAGSFMGVMPGVMGIAAYSPMVNGVGISVRSAQAIADVMNTLGISALGSARVTVDPEK